MSACYDCPVMAPEELTRRVAEALALARFEGERVAAEVRVARRYDDASRRDLYRLATTARDDLADLRAFAIEAAKWIV